MDLQFQTSAKSAAKIVHGTRGILNAFNAMDSAPSLTGFSTLLQEFQAEGADAVRKQQKISQGIWRIGSPPSTVNTPYYAGISEVITQNRTAEIEYFNNANACLKDVLVANLQGSLETDQPQLSDKVRDTLNSLDQMGLSTQIRERLFDAFKDEFADIAPDSEALNKIFEGGLQAHNHQTLKDTLSKFMVSEIQPAQELEDTRDNSPDGPSM
ncbi:hypothetical protein L1281_001764 [Neisseria sp. HSC-16F19]|nr:hypothetical protein [Neisseria sp. HSC-16F19]MCP2041170.1 hypothetical protein [Neisseria sp. HSC-16F19]